MSGDVLERLNRRAECADQLRFSRAPPLERIVIVVGGILDDRPDRHGRAGDGTPPPPWPVNYRMLL